MRLYMHEVCLRDGFQMEKKFVPTQEKIALANHLSRTGIAKLEVTSFSSPKAIPTLSDAEAVMRGIERVPGVRYTALVPNLRGAVRALDCNLDELNFVMSASRTHNLANLRMPPEQSVKQIREIFGAASEARCELNVSLSTAFGCPFEGEIALSHVSDLVQMLVDVGISNFTLCDTTGMANPSQVVSLFNLVRSKWPEANFTAHFHDTRSMGLANAFAALQTGIVRFDASLGGLGGCPFAPGASGNVCTEDLVHMFNSMGHDTGVDLERLLGVARLLPGLVDHDVPGQILKAGPSTRRYPPPGAGSSPQCL